MYGQKSVALPRPTSVCIVTRTPDTDIARSFTPTLSKQKCLASSISRCLRPAPYSLAAHYNQSPTPKSNGQAQCRHPLYQTSESNCFDYRTHIVKGNRIRQNGITRGATVAGQDMADCILYLQKRWEDARGNIYAKRVGTMVHRFSSSTNWRNNQSFAIHYGDIRRQKFYNSAWGLTSGALTKYARNSKGRMVPVREVGWAAANEVPTHIVLQFDSSHGGAYVGTVGNTLWVDNVRLAY